VKQRLRAAIEAGLRHLPGARAAYAERDKLRQLLLTSEARLASANASLAAHELRWQNMEFEVAHVLKQANPTSKNRLFDAFANVGLSDYLYVEADRARFIVNARDQVISRRLFVHGSADFSKFEVAADLLKRHTDIREIDLLIDVGADIGSICIPAVAQGFVKRAIALEPHPTNHQLLCANVALNGLLDCIDVIQRAASAGDDETLIMEVSNNNWGDHRISSSERTGGRYGEADRARIEVQSIKIDSLNGLRRDQTLLVWMDIQGYEGHALRGASQVLAEKPPLVLEFWPYGMRRSDSFSALCSSTVHYSGFVDLANPMHPLRKMADLSDLFDAVGLDGAYTDILVI